MACRSLCRLCLQRMCRSINHQPRELPLPEVNSRSLTKGPGLMFSDSGACTSSEMPHTKADADTSDVTPLGPTTKHSQSQPAGTMHSANAASCSGRTVQLVPQTPPVGGDSAMVDVRDDDVGAMHAKTKSRSAGGAETDFAMKKHWNGEDHAMEGSEQGASRDAEAGVVSRRKVWPSNLPDLVSSTRDRTCDSMKWLQEWLAYGESSV